MSNLCSSHKKGSYYKGGATNLNVGGGNALEGGGGNTVKTLTFEKGEGCMTPPSSYGGAAL